VEDKDDVENEFYAFNQHDEECGQEKVVQQNGNHFTTNLHNNNGIIHITCRSLQKYCLSTRDARIIISQLTSEVVYENESF